MSADIINKGRPLDSEFTVRLNVHQMKLVAASVSMMARLTAQDPNLSSQERFKVLRVKNEIEAQLNGAMRNAPLDLVAQMQKDLSGDGGF